ncbi:glycosyltransferase family 39 protein [Rhizobiaceae bacterium n13]|uniref:Glycosyltransferase family 39 protein n=1 Tax=Ferirhizobium litorale TaxID=2927786 RepID=A0AAE3Q8W5_9HYPH|nr:glycosyltransferase family 39 protein [Fererhizobium litorale]MDI7861215.1 glycosyltransferase family 39 protein [Fererhizobium litorale]MDI7921362.1 glycosyltransferase family 39 protein [Fererhizobium litorale]
MLLAVYFVVQVLLRLWLPHALELDEAEQIFYSQWLLPGYGPQPPLYNWLQMAMFAFTGPTLVGLAVLKNAMLFSCYVFLALAATQTLKDTRMQAVSVLALLTLPQVSFIAQQDLTHTVALLATSAMFIYALFLTIRTGNAAAYALVGLATGLGFLAKYNFVLLPVAAFLALAMDKRFRDRIVDRRIFIAFAIAGVVALPHGLWLIDNLGAATTDTLGKMAANQASGRLSAMLTGLGSLAVAIVASSALTMAIFAGVLGKQTITALRAQTPLTKMIERMFMIILIGLIVIIVATGTTKIRERWLDPFLLILPLYLCLKIEAAGLVEVVTRKRLFPIAAAILVVVPSILLARVVAAPIIGKYTKLNLPFDSVMPKLLATFPSSPGVIIANHTHLAGNLRLAVPDVPVLSTEAAAFDLPFDWSQDRPALLIWRVGRSADGSMPDDLDQWLRSRQDMRDATVAPGKVTMPYHYGRDGDAYEFGYAWVYPPNGPTS